LAVLARGQITAKDVTGTPTSCLPLVLPGGLHLLLVTVLVLAEIELIFLPLAPSSFRVDLVQEEC